VAKIPLTLYGKGQQTRAFIHIENSMDCIELALQNPPTENKVQIFNQITETHRLIDIVSIFECPYEYLPNPRNENESNELTVKNDQFLNLGLQPIYLTKEEIRTLCQFVEHYKDSIKIDALYPSSSWK
jgi:UDP-sulfoquinovose synthase